MEMERGLRRRCFGSENFAYQPADENVIADKIRTRPVGLQRIDGVGFIHVEKGKMGDPTGTFGDKNISERAFGKPSSDFNSLAVGFDFIGGGRVD